jgi:hypothetical protein
MDFEKITNQELDEIDLNLLAEVIINQEHKNYFLEKSSTEHYRILSYISEKNDNLFFLDVGSFKGLSALAFSKNKKNFVFSFDLANLVELIEKPQNAEYIIDDVTKNEYIELILKCKYILLDTMHTGEFERHFYNHLKKINYKGYLLLDDIKLNQEMIDFWNYIDLPKKDISNLGHTTGTGVVFFR